MPSHNPTRSNLKWFSTFLVAYFVFAGGALFAQDTGTAATVDLAAKIRERLAEPSIRRGHIGIKITTLDGTKTIFEQNAEKYFMPASNMKSFTVAAALERLSPDFRFETPIVASAKPDNAGTITGDVYILGRGDISASYGFYDGDNFRGIDRLVDALIAAGVKKIDGNIIGDDRYFRGSPLPNGWEWDDLQWYYGAEVSALPLNDNVVTLSVVPGPIGYQCAAKVLPFNFVIRVHNRCVTTSAGTERTLRIEKKLGENLIEISGNLPIDNPGFNGTIAVSRPAEIFASMVKQRLTEKGVSVAGQGHAIRIGPVSQDAPAVEIARVESPPMALIAARTMKPSQNMYTEVLLWTLGEQARIGKVPRTNSSDGRAAGADSSALGIEAVKVFLKEIGVDDEGIIQYDGSGLSRHNLVTPAALARLYTFMATQSRYRQAWLDSLTIGGVDGTLRNRFKGTRGEANVRGKTGTIDQVSALSGYVTTAAGERLVFSMLVNGVQENRTRVGLIDDIVLMLANHRGAIAADQTTNKK